MAARRPRPHRRLLATAVAIGTLPGALIPAVEDLVTPPPADIAAGPPCVNGVVPLNPYIVNCNLPPRGPHIRGAAPDAGAIIACRHIPVCISYYVNYPGQLIVPGLTP